MRLRKFFLKENAGPYSVKPDNIAKLKTELVFSGKENLTEIERVLNLIK